MHTPDISVEVLKSAYAYSDSQFMKVEGIPVHYRIRGEGPDLVLLHGTAASLHTWEEWTTLLEQDFRIISMDLPAFGLTGPFTGNDYSVESYLRFLQQFTNQLQLDSFSLAGNSLGGLIAWNYAAQYPQQVERLILLDPSGIPTNKPAPLAMRLARNSWTSPLLLFFTPKSLFEKSLKEVYYDSSKIKQKVLDRYYQLGLREGNRQAFVDRQRSLSKADTSLLRNIQAPTLIQWGKHDQWIPVEHAAHFAKAIPNAKAIIYENAGHIPMEEIPLATARDAKAFLIDSLSAN